MKIATAGVQFKLLMKNEEFNFSIESCISIQQEHFLFPEAAPLALRNAHFNSSDHVL